MFQTSFRSTVYNPSRFQRNRNNLQLVIIISLIGVIFITYYNTSNNLDGVISALGFSSTSTSTSTSAEQEELDDGNFHGRYPNSLLTLFYPYTMFRDVVLDQPINMTDIPFFWHVHNSDEYIYKNVLTNCYGLEIIELNDISSIERAKEVNLVSGLHRSTHVITSPFIRETAEIFTTDHFGRMICFVRHPLDYDVHTSLPTFPKKDNWLTRLISNIHEDELNQYHLAVAKQVIRQDCLVGTLDKMKLSIIRFQEHWGWKYTRGMTVEEGEQCIDDAMNSVGMPQETWLDHEGEEFKSFYEFNYFDCQLYELSQSAWRHQLQTIVPWELQLSRDEDDDE